MVKEIRLSKNKTLCFGTHQGFGIGFVVSKWALNIDLGIFWIALEW